MNWKQTIAAVAVSGLAVMGIAALLVGSAQAHCDTTSGPIIPEAVIALEEGDVTPILKWVRPDDEAELKRAFAKAVFVRAQGPEAKELADRYLLETLVRLHRAGEGAPYTGIKDEPAEPVVAMAEKALADGSPDEMIERISRHMAQLIREKLDRALETKKNKDKTVAAGRQFVEAYVTYMHYVEGIHNAIVSPADHRAEATGGAGTHAH